MLVMKVCLFSVSLSLSLPLSLINFARQTKGTRIKAELMNTLIEISSIFYKLNL